MTTITLPPLVLGEHITEHPHVVQLDGVPMLRGSRLRVRLIAQMYRAGDAVEDILRAYPQLNASAVHDAISYYLDHRVELEREIAAQHIDNVLEGVGAKMDERGFVTFPSQA